LKEDRSTGYCCFADDPSLTDLERGIYAEAIWKLKHHKNLRNRKREEVYSFFKANLRKAASKRTELTDVQENRTSTILNLAP